MTSKRQLSAGERLRRILFPFLRYGFLILFAVTCIFPFFWMVSTSFKTEAQAVRMPPLLLPPSLYLGNYAKILEGGVLVASVGNSLLISLTSVIGTLISSSLAAYAFAKLRFRGSGILFGALIATMMVPGQVTLIPLYIIFSNMGWVNTYLPLIVPRVMLNGYAVFMLRQFMKGIPDSYSESAQLDGAGQVRIWAQIIVPLCKPTLVTLALFGFISAWNDFMTPLIYINDMEKFTVPLAISMFKDQYSRQWGTTMAASSITILPIVILYFFSQRFFIQGIALSGVKG